MATITVMEYERVVLLVDGEVRRVLEPGRHRYRRNRSVPHRLDLRPRLITVPGQEVLTADKVMVRASVVLRASIAEPVEFVTSSQDPWAETYAAVQRELRAAVTELTLDALLAARPDLGDGLLAQVQRAGARVGISVAEVALRDVMLPGELRRAYAETLLAQQRGRAELERARGEAAALRSLANTARLLEEHPALLRLRTLQLAEQDGTDLRLTVSQ